jgi:starch-binding outer membrane protein, SusD/RagB family
MKKIKIYNRMKPQRLVLPILVGLILTSCEKMLDTKPDNQYGDEFTWNLPDKAEGVLVNAYANIMIQWDHWSGNNFLDVATDNAVTNDFSSGLYSMISGSLSNQSNPIGNWSTAYNQFRNIHLFLENGLNENIRYSVVDDDVDQAIRQRLLGEAFFLRAWWGMELLRMYGGIAEDGQALGYVIITRNLSMDDLQNVGGLQRNTYEVCVQQITNDLESAIKYLPLDYTGPDRIIGNSQFGRANQKTAWALMSRVHTMAASPAFQPQGTYAISTDSIEKKWQRAAITSYKAINEGQLGSFTALTTANFNPSTTPADFLFRMHFNNNHMESRNYPPAFFGQGRANPSQNLVDAFYDSRGYPIDHDQSNYDPQDPYANRDPRLALTVYYNGRVFDNRPLEVYYNSETNTYGRDATGYDYRNTRTGYYLRKWLSTTRDMLNPIQTNNDRHMHALLRRSEVYFNLAEALNEAVGPSFTLQGAGNQTAASLMTEIRGKSMTITSDPYLISVANDGQDAFRKLIQNERRLEFAFENMRYFDLRRWLLPLDEPVRGCVVTKTSEGFVYQGTDPNGEAIIVEERMFNDPKYYYSPLPYSELIKNSNLKDNKGWFGR